MPGLVRVPVVGWIRELLGLPQVVHLTMPTNIAAETTKTQ